MKCDIGLAELSAHFDGEETVLTPAEMDAHAAACPRCRAYLDGLTAVRRHLRLEALDAPIDVAPRVLAAIAQSKRRRTGLVPAAAFLVGLVIGAVVFTAGPGPRNVLAFPLRERMVEVQRIVGSLRAEFMLVEHNFHTEVPERRYEGSLVFVSPETAWLNITDLTAYPDPGWTPNDIEVVVDGDRAWSTGSPSCPALALPRCAPSEPNTEIVTRRDPFSELTPAPLELVVPISSFRLGGEPVRLEGPAPVDRPAVGMEITAAQAEPMLDGLFSAGHWRQIHPTDIVELWLDREFLVPVAMSIFPSEVADRRTWEARRGYTDPAGQAYLELLVTDLRVNFPGQPALPPQPSATTTLDAGFRREDRASPAEPPGGFDLVAAGTVDNGSQPIQVWAWSDGVAYLRLTTTTGWGGPGLFGNRGSLVKRQGDLFLSLDENTVYVHGLAADAIVSGSVPTETLLEVAESMAIGSSPLPGTWIESGAVALEEAAIHLPGLLALIGDGEFGEPAATLSGPGAILDYAGGGTRGFRLIERPGAILTPPLDPDARAVNLRGLVGRFNPSRGELEWVEGGIVISLASPSIDIGELVQIAELLDRP